MTSSPPATPHANTLSASNLSYRCLARYAALEHAAVLLRADGLLGVADFYVARKHPPPEMAAHSWLQRTFWPAWFAMDDVRLNADHVPFLQRKFAQVQVRTVRRAHPAAAHFCACAPLSLALPPPRRRAPRFAARRDCVVGALRRLPATKGAVLPVSRLATQVGPPHPL